MSPGNQGVFQLLKEVELFEEFWCFLQLSTAISTEYTNTYSRDFP
jgi:hypothetical protein